MSVNSRESPRTDPTPPGVDPAGSVAGCRHPGLDGDWKRLLDLAVCPILLLVSAPVILLLMILVRATSRGPALYRQVRVGLGGAPFTIYKIRTMYHRIEDRTGPRWTATGDSGITPIGMILREMHLDELPQLWNVLIGDMSLVGPRPERPEFVGQLERAILHYRDRLAVRPGLTGLAQVHLPADRDLDDVRRKLVYDLYYIRHASPWLDLRLIACSALVLLGIPYDRSCRYLQVPPRRAVEGPAMVEPAMVEPSANLLSGQLHAEGI